jgi:hypothetical protein
MRCGRYLAIVLLAGLVLAAGPARAAPAGAAGEVGLVVSGKVAGGRQLLSMEDLGAAGVDEVVARVPWARGAARFAGLPLRHLLAMVGASGTSIEARDGRGNRTNLSIEEALARNALIAISHEGEPIAQGGSGPYWLIYPEPEGAGRRSGLGPPPLPRLLELRIH